MKINTKILSGLLLVSATTVVWAHTQEQAVEHVVITKQVHACHCVPTEHWFHKVCVQRYIAQFPECGLQANYDTEGLPANILQAIEMLAGDIVFVADDGTAIVPELNAKGKLILPLGKNSDVRLCKQILHPVDVTTSLAAEELYQEWKQLLLSMQSAQ